MKKVVTIPSSCEMIESELLKGMKILAAGGRSVSYLVDLPTTQFNKLIQTLRASIVEVRDHDPEVDGG